MPGILTLLPLLALACASSAPAGTAARGDEIVACGERIPIGTRVVLWTGPGGFDAYGTATREGPPEARFGARRGLALPVSLAALREHVHQLVLHYDAAGTSRRCFEILHHRRKLSCHFLLDLDGTIYQTLDLKERAWHAAEANDRSVGVEIANLGAFPVRSEGMDVTGEIHGARLHQAPFTDAQYEALAHLAAGLARVLPRIRLDAPRTPRQSVATTTLPDGEALAFPGLVGHYHLTRAKVDPGPAFDWERLLARARQLGDSR